MLWIPKFVIDQISTLVVFSIFKNYIEFWWLILFANMEAVEAENGNCIKSWETYKILNKIKENVQHKRRIAKDVFVFINNIFLL